MFKKTPIEIAKCWNRAELAKFLENPEQLEKIPVTPNMLSAQKKSAQKTDFCTIPVQNGGISARTQKLIQKQERQGYRLTPFQNSQTKLKGFQ